ncbi:hypothetical protein M5689_016087 [Euphorbia peplus]|nr:hypothetical protein M5689_016087 [Euphorbia peplus]
MCYCNGLVLMFIWRELSVWNPSTRQYKILPAFPVKNVQSRSFALGYDSVADDYKAVAIIWKKGWDISRVWIFELKSSCWRSIQDFPYFDYCYRNRGGNGDCFVDGTLHSICYPTNDLN